MLVNRLTEVSPGIFLVPTVPQKKGNAGAAGIDAGDQATERIAARGWVLARGGIEAILEAASAVDPRTEIVFWGTAPGDDADGRGLMCW